ncbi:EmrB/QacA subfamily drug resistance transporter [Thermocatellispora tengchongensis]|uniref:EmrB/QacA subfamily drug resistance transporter n=1 Tax=Thermocatellispora tengchongensis TaxID=1073253 RepID=A0A840P8E9_9ACTN|nr:MFS transporter [Thermocatellispora tengchongensis]MBB5135269.1 EmrB/QacA subfamily drug resistance transporter [Thermocatellispora tengchongensis]
MGDLVGRRRRVLVLAICCTSLFIVALDNTIINVALPAIARDLDAPLSGMQWTIDAYTLVLASLLMLSGSTADRIGRRRTFQTGLVIFSAGSLLCSVAPSVTWLVVFRMVQAVGGSMLNPVAMSIITNTFTEPRERARAIGVWGGVAGLSMALGPLIGGLLVEPVGWRAIFWINVPIGIAAIVLTAVFVPESRAPRPRRIDPGGQLLVAVLLAALTTGIIEGPNAGWGSPLIVGCFAVAALSLIGLVLYEPRRDEPLLDLRFFRSAPFSGAAAIAVSAFAALGGFLFLNTVYLQTARGLSPLQAGLCTLPMALTALVTGPLSGRLVAARGTRPSLLIAGVAYTAACAMLSFVTPATPLPALLAIYAVFGLGFGVVNTPITNTAVSGMPRAQAGVAAGVASTSRQIGQSLGVAIAGSVVASSLTGSLGAGFTDAARAGWWILSGCGVVILSVGLLTSGRWARRTASRVAEIFERDEAKAGVR